MKMQYIFLHEKLKLNVCDLMEILTFSKCPDILNGSNLDLNINVLFRVRLILLYQKNFVEQLNTWGDPTYFIHPWCYSC